MTTYTDDALVEREIAQIHESYKAKLAAAEAERAGYAASLETATTSVTNLADQVARLSEENVNIEAERDRLLRMMNQHGSYNVLAESCTLVVRNCGLWHISRDGGPKATAVEYTELKDAIEAALEDKT